MAQTLAMSGILCTGAADQGSTGSVIAIYDCYCV